MNEFDLHHFEQQGIPAPTLSPEERLRRRLSFRNDRTFYKRTCDLCKKSFISMYAQDSEYTIFCPSCWWSDKWDPTSQGQSVDLNRPFFDQFAELMKKVPRLGMDIVNCENSDFCNYCGDDKNCYFDIAGEANEDCYFNLFTKYSKNCVDTTFAYHSTLCYESIHVQNCYNTKYSMYCSDSYDLTFCYDMKGCHDCLFSWNLRNKQYYIANQPYTKEDYFKKLEELNLGSFSNLERARETWKNFRTKNVIYRDSYLINTENCTGDNITNSKNTFESFNATNCEDSKFLYDVLDAKDCFDLNYSLYKPEVCTELISTLAMSYSAFCMASHYCSNCFYTDMCNNSNNLFGCIGLNRKAFCILNKQYSQDEYDDLKAKLIGEMTKRGEWGEFFPAAISPHAYNEVVAQEYLPLSKQEALARGYKWKDSDIKQFQPSTVRIADSIADVDSAVTQEILTCEKCTKNYRLISQEFAFYKTNRIPIPRKCPDCRHFERNALRSPRKLFDRACSQCSASIKSTLSADRPETVYCEKCYLETVY